jgi:predicted dienelactone hydrolase
LPAVKAEMLPLTLLLLAGQTESRSITLHDSARGKDLPVRITWPTAKGTYPVIVFSHGFRGSKDNMDPLVRPWAEHGYVVILPTHEDSIALMPAGQRRDAMQTGGANGFATWRSRIEDDEFIIDSLASLETKIPALKGKLDPKTVGVGGHSFGAHTADALAGMTLARRSFADPRPKAFLLLSPQGKGLAQGDDAWRGCTRPMMVVSGTEDKTPIDDPRTTSDPTRRQDAFRLSPAGDKYLVWIDGATHNFGGITGSFLWPGAGKPNKQHVEWVQRASLAFWDAYLKSDRSAKKTLEAGFKEKGITVERR